MKIDGYEVVVDIYAPDGYGYRQHGTNIVYVSPKTYTHWQEKAKRVEYEKNFDKDVEEMLSATKDMY